MISDMLKIEGAARRVFGSSEEDAPLPPAPNYGPFGYFRLAMLGFAAFVAMLLILSLV